MVDLSGDTRLGGGFFGEGESIVHRSRYRSHGRGASGDEGTAGKGSGGRGRSHAWQGNGKSDG
jgi:hypothetical protein